MVACLQFSFNLAFHLVGLPASNCYLPITVRSARVGIYNRSMHGCSMPESWHGHGQSPRSIVELGAGDGTHLARLAKSHCAPPETSTRCARRSPAIDESGTKSEFNALLWPVEFLEMDVFDWLQRPHNEHSDLTIANLFLHHFTEDHLRRLLWPAAVKRDVL